MYSYIIFVKPKFLHINFVYILQESRKLIINALCHVRELMEIGYVTYTAQTIALLEDNVMLQKVENYHNVVATTIVIKSNNTF